MSNGPDKGRPKPDKPALAFRGCVGACSQIRKMVATRALDESPEEGREILSHAVGFCVFPYTRSLSSAQREFVSVCHQTWVRSPVYFALHYRTSGKRSGQTLFIVRAPDDAWMTV